MKEGEESGRVRGVGGGERGERRRGGGRGRGGWDVEVDVSSFESLFLGFVVKRYRNEE